MIGLAALALDGVGRQARPGQVEQPAGRGAVGGEDAERGLVVDRDVHPRARDHHAAGRRDVGGGGLARALASVQLALDADRGDVQGATPGVKQTASQVTPAPTVEVEHAGRVPLVLDQRIRPRVLDRDRPPVGDDLAAAGEDRPHAARLVGARPRAGAVAASARRPAPPGRPRAAPARPARARRRAAPGSRARSRRRRPRRSGTRRARARARRAPTGSARASPRCRRRSTAAAAGRQDRVLDPQPLDGRAHRVLVARRLEAGRVHRDDLQAVGRVAVVPRLDVGQRAQRADAAEVPELDEDRTAALLVHAQRRDVRPRQLGGERRRGDRVDGRLHRESMRTTARNLWPVTVSYLTCGVWSPATPPCPVPP